MGKVVQLFGAGIGLASEALASRKQSSHNTNPHSSLNGNNNSSTSIPPIQHSPYDPNTPPQYDSLPNARPYSSTDEKDSKHAIDTDEQEWALDEAASSQTDDDGLAPSLEELKNLFKNFIHKHPAPPPPAPKDPLPCCVILPQRRPRDKKRGFVRAYAPVLQDAGVDQNAFLDFLKIFKESTKESKSLHVINMAAAGAGFVPSPIAMAVSTAAQVAVGVAMEVQRRTKTNSFLDDMNDQYFKPRGLYCLIMTYEPDDPRPAPRFDLSGKIKKIAKPNAQEPGDMSINDHINTSLGREDATGMAKTMGKMRLSTGKTYGEPELPESAPLIYPDLDQLSEGKKKGMGSFVADYMDRRAQANFASENEGSHLGEQNVHFNSAMADPNHKMYNGGVVNLLTGGRYDPRDRMLARRANRHGEEFDPNAKRTGILGLNIGGKRKPGMVRKALRKNVLYLLVTNLPSEKEMREGAEIVQRDDGGEFGFNQQSSQAAHGSYHQQGGYPTQQQGGQSSYGDYQQGDYRPSPQQSYEQYPQQQGSHGPQQDDYNSQAPQHQHHYPQQGGYISQGYGPQQNGYLHQGGNGNDGGYVGRY